MSHRRASFRNWTGLLLAAAIVVSAPFWFTLVVLYSPIAWMFDPHYSAADVENHLGSQMDSALGSAMTEFSSRIACVDLEAERSGQFLQNFECTMPTPCGSVLRFDIWNLQTAGIEQPVSALERAAYRACPELITNSERRLKLEAEH